MFLLDRIRVQIPAQHEIISITTFAPMSVVSLTFVVGITLLPSKTFIGDLMYRSRLGSFTGSLILDPPLSTG
jgi:hypothetical protein